LKKLVNRIFIIPILFFIFGIVAFSIFYFFFVDDVSKKEFHKVNNGIIQNEKKILKSSLDSVVDGVSEIRSAGYITIENLLKEFLSVYKKEYSLNNQNQKDFFIKHSSDDVFLYLISQKMVHPGFYQKFITIGKNKYLTTIYKNKQYLSVETKNGDGLIGLAFSMDVIEKLIKNEIIDYIKDINEKYPESFILIGKINNWFSHGKGEIIYNPLANKNLKIDPNNENFKKIVNCLKTKDSCFILFDLNDSGKKDKLLAYVKVYRPYNWFFLKGVYYSQILGEIENIQEDIVEDATEIFIGTTIALFVITFINFIISLKLSRKIMQQVLQSYDKLKNNYENSKNELIRRYYYDTLTDLPNMNKLIEDIKNKKSLILLDIDDFSDINDIYGFDFGDEVLKEVKKSLTKKFTNVYRIGSDTFAILMDKEVNEKDLLDLLNHPIKYKNIKINFTIGASNSKEKLLETAESALKVTLKDSTTKYKLYDENITNIQKEKLEKLQIIYKILEKKAVIPYYQCIVDRDQKVIKYEALMRINDNGKILSPFYFLDLIKEAKLYPYFSAIMIEKVFNDLEKLNKPVALNLSFEDIANKELREKLLKLLDSKPKDKVVIFEILESESIKDFDLVVSFIQKVKQKGGKISIDDFGTGYSNFVNVLQLYPDYVKIDQSLIKNIEDEKYKEIVKLITEFAHRFSILTTAEFVFNKEIFEKLLELGVDEFQGFYFCEPKPIDELKD